MKFYTCLGRLEYYPSIERGAGSQLLEPFGRRNQVSPNVWFRRRFYQT